MSILKYKYQAHKFINYIFYIIVFVIGFLFGYGSKEINLNKLISNVLFIDNVSAYEINIDDHIVVTESDILDNVNIYVSDFDYDYNNNVFCTWTSYSSYYELSCLLLNDLDWSNIYLTNYSSGSNSRVTVNISQSTNTIYSVFHYSKSTYELSFSNAYRSVFSSAYNSLVSRIFTNTNFSSNENSTINNEQLKQINKSINKLDFITPQLNYNENLFANNDNFKQVCVENDTYFSISNINQSSIDVFYDYDFIWFPYDVVSGLSRKKYDTRHPDDGYILNYVDDSEHFNFDSYSSINSIINENNSNGRKFIEKGYTSSNSLYGWSAFPFFTAYDSSVTTFDIYHLKNPFIHYIDGREFYTVDGENSIGASIGAIHGGVGSIYSDHQYPPNYCFYIKNEYSVDILNVDELGDIYGSVETPNGEINIQTSENNSSSGGINDLLYSFKTNTFGLNTIITSPLNAIQKISSGTCSPQTISILNKDITLPCGTTIFWNREDVSTFKTFWNMFWGGIICYGIGVSLYKLILKLKDPYNDKIEVLDL